MQGHAKSELQWLYNTKYTTNLDSEEKEKVFKYCSLRFWFGGASFRNSEKLLLFVEIPVSFFESKSLLSDMNLRWYEEIRPLDVFCCGQPYAWT